MRTGHAPHIGKTPTSEDTQPVAPVDAAGAWRGRLRSFVLSETIAASAHAARQRFSLAYEAAAQRLSSLRRSRGPAEECEDAEQRRERAQGRSVAPTPGERGDATPDAQNAATAGAKTDRLHRLIVYLCVMVVGSIAGMALAYGLLAQRIERRSATINHQQDEVAERSRSIAQREKRLFRQGTPESAPGSGSGSGSGASAGAQDPAGSAECTVGGGNIRSVLIGCVNELNQP